MSLITDTPPLLQPEGSYSFALNVINSTKDNGTSSISSEPFFQTIVQLPINYSVIGNIYFSNKILIFSTDNITSEIGVLDKDIYTRKYSGNLGFNKDHKILGEHRILAGCEDVFYFMDGINPDRYFNLDDIPTDTSLFSILQKAKEPELNVTINNTGGRMPSSGVSFLIEYTNLNGDVFDSSEPTTSLPVYNDTISSSAQGSTETTNKSATINVTNIDTRFPYIRLVAIHNVEGNYQVYQIDNLVATNTDLTIEYQGPTDQDIRLDNREVQVGRAQYNTSLVSEQVQGRLLRANVQEITEDYSGHQLLVNQIKVLPEIVTIPKTNFSQDPQFYKEHLTFQSDEVYALGIRFTSQTKVPTPVYHIPGRAALSGELDEIEFNNETYKRFEVENTAQQLNRSTRGMGYYQTNTVYPNITDCSDSNNLVYGNLAGTPVRHHKMPSRRTVALEQGNSLQAINITLDDVTIPQGYTDYELLYVPRTDSNSTVLDSGYLTPAREVVNVDNPNEIVNYIGEFGYFNTASTGSISSQVSTFNSIRSLIGDNLKGNYFDLITTYGRNEVTISQSRTNINTIPDVSFTAFNSQIISNPNRYESYDQNFYINTQSRNSSDFNLPLINRSYSNLANVYELNSKVGLGIDTTQTYSVNKRIASVNNNIQSLIYKPLVKTNNQYQGDTFIHPFSMITLSNVGAGESVLQSFTLVNLFVESKNNGQLLIGDHYLIEDDIQYTISKISTEGIIDLEEYNLNQGYNYGSIKSYFPLPLTYDYCNKCRSANPTRIIYSPQSFQEELSDAYLISNNNDYIDLPANTGPITGIKYKSNRLYVHTTQTTYVLSPNPQYLSTNQLVAQLQTGDFLSIPPQEIIQTDYGYGGLQSKTGTMNTEYGYFWLDGLRGSFNSITDSFKSVSNQGMMNWFKNNTTTESDVIMAFDPFYHRLITTIHNDDNCQPFHTLSYHLNSNTFTCFHTYNPNHYLNNSTFYYSTYGNKIKKHLQDGKYLPIVIEEVNKSMSTQNLISLTYYAEFFNGDNEIIDTYTDVTIYNSNQSSGKLELYLAGPYDSLFYQPNKRPVKIQNKNSSTSNIWDNSTSSVVYTKPCNELVYTDKKFINTRLEGEHYDKPIFTEKYTITRLEYNKNNRVTHYLLQQNKQQSIR